MNRFLLKSLTISAICLSLNANALMINWTDWTTSNSTNGFTAIGSITSGLEVIDVTYNNPQGVGFIQTGSGTDYFQNGRSGRDPATSPYTSEGPNGVDNIPPAAEMIALQFAGTQTLSFSQPIANPYFAYVSLNQNGYGFDQDFELLSNTGSNLDGSSNGPDDFGYWGCGTSEKVLPSPGVYELNQAQQSCGTEPHGVLRFTGIFSQVSWVSLSNEFWNGFTVGIQGTDDQVFPCQVNPSLPECQSDDPNDNPNNEIPEPSTITLLALAAICGRRVMMLRKK